MPAWYGLSRNHRRSSVDVITTATPPIIVACTTARSALSAKNSMNPKMMRALKSSTIHNGTGITPSAPWVRSAPRVLAGGTLVEPFRVGRLLGGGSWLDGPEGAKRGHAPGIDRVAEGTRLHLRPLLVDHRPRVADEFARKAGTRRDGEELGRLELLRDDLRLRLGAGSRGVEALERKEDDEPEQHGEPRREDAEDAGGAVPVLEVASRRGLASDEQHRRDRNGRDTDDDEACPEEVHGLITGRTCVALVFRGP